MPFSVSWHTLLEEADDLPAGATLVTPLSHDEVRVTDVLLGRLHHDRPVSGQFGSVQRTERRNRSLKDEETVLNALEAAGVDREQVTSVDRNKVDDALDVTGLSPEDVYRKDSASAPTHRGRG